MFIVRIHLEKDITKTNVNKLIKVSILKKGSMVHEHTLSSNSRICNWATNSVTAGIGVAARKKKYEKPHRITLLKNNKDKNLWKEIKIEPLKLKDATI